jgi:hypothetical protein
MRLPNLFLLGAAKCGTTSLANWLQQHPLVHVAPSKEPTFFCRHFNVIHNPIDYLEQFCTNKAAKYFVDASHGNFSDLAVAPALHALVPEAKFILVLRNPVRRAYSLYQHMRRHGHEGLATFAEALAAEPFRAADPYFKFAARENYCNQLYLDSSRYDQQLLRYLEFFPRESFFIMTMQEMLNETDFWLGELCKFLQIALALPPVLPRKNDGRYEPLDPVLLKSLLPQFQGCMNVVNQIAGRDLRLGQGI